MSTKKKNEELEKRGPTEVSAFDYGTDASEGEEDRDREHLLIPFVTVLQALSPQCQDEDRFPGARPGMLINTVTEELYDGKTGIEFVPALLQHAYVEWVARKEGGGFVGVHDAKSDIVRAARESSAKFGHYKTEEGHDLSETFYVYGVACVDGDVGESIVIAFTSTKISVYKRWNTALSMFTVKLEDGRKQKPPIFAHRVRLTTTQQENNHGKFFNYVLRPAVQGENAIMRSLLKPGHPVLEAARSFREMIKKGSAKADHTRRGDDGDDDKPAPF